MSDKDSAWEEEGGGDDDNEEDDDYSLGDKSAGAGNKRKRPSSSEEKGQEKNDDSATTKSQSDNNVDNNNDRGAEEQPKAISPRRPKKPRRIVITEEEIEAESFIPSYERLTANGGYAATAAHRRKIGLANTGNVPWNKGKNRSAADKAKIKAAVQARNRRQLLANLQSVQMTEDEYAAYRKKIKMVRESVRKAKIVAQGKKKKQGDIAEEALQNEEDANDNEEWEEEDAKLATEETPVTASATETTPSSPTTTADKTVQAAAEALPPPTATAAATTPPQELSVEDALEQKIKQSWHQIWTKKASATIATGEMTTVVDPPVDANLPPAEQSTAPTNDDDQETEKAAKDVVTNNRVERTANATTQTESDEKGEKEEEKEYDIEIVPEIFRRDFEWTPHPVFGYGQAPSKSTEQEQSKGATPFSLSSTCPTGGPGGLICCASCTSTYGDYLNATLDELQSQKIAKVADELDTITKFLRKNEARLCQSVRLAKRQSPPKTLGET